MDAFKGAYLGRALFSALGRTLGVLGVFSYVTGDVSSTFSVVVNLVAYEDAALVTGGEGLSIWLHYYFSSLCHCGSLSPGGGSRLQTRATLMWLNVS